jgi:hypothetical protein
MSPPTPPSARTNQHKAGHRGHRPKVNIRILTTIFNSGKELLIIILGILLLVIGFVAGISILWTIGIVVVIIGLILALLGMAGHAVGGRRHYF